MMDWQILVDWRVRLLGEKVLSLLPGSYQIHRRFQRANTPKYSEYVRDHVVKWKIDLWEYFFCKTGFQFPGARVIEIGTGWNGVDLILMHLLGADEIHTFDKLPHFSIEACRYGVEGLKGNLEKLEKGLGIIRALEKISEIPLKDKDGFMRHINACYHVGMDLKDLNFDSGSINLFYSYSTLQHLPLDKLKETFSEAKRVLADGAFLYNDLRFIDNNYKGQKGLNPFGYLSCPDWLWRILQCKKFNYQNRVRHMEFLEMLNSAGFTLVDKKRVEYDESLIRSISLDKRFSTIPVDDLRIANGTFIHKWDR